MVSWQSIVITIYVIGFLVTAWLMWRTGSRSAWSIWFRIVGPIIWPLTALFFGALALIASGDQ